MVKSSKQTNKQKYLLSFTVRKEHRFSKSCLALAAGDGIVLGQGGDLGGLGEEHDDFTVAELRFGHRFPYSPSQIEIMSRKVKKVNGLDFRVKRTWKPQIKVDVTALEVNW